jgi:putative ABC transport system ATP-binding protein
VVFMSDSLIELKNVSKTFMMGQVPVHALKGIDLTIEKGECISIIGPSGSGKTTLLYLIGCLLSPTSGVYNFRGEEVQNMGQRQLASIRGGGIGFVFQAFNLLPRYTALENVELPMVYSRAPAGKRKERAREVLDQLGLSGRIRHRPNRLSGGEQQRVAIARALVNGPSIVLADEPTGNLDTESGNMIVDTLLELNERGTTVIIVTHEHSIAERTGRTISLLDGGMVDVS